MSFKLAQYLKAELELAKQVAQFEALKADPELKKELEFNESLDEFLEAHNMTRQKLQQFLSLQGIPASSSGGSKSNSGARPYNRQPGRYYTNPHTNETILVKRKDNGVLQGWVEQYGLEVVQTWQQAS